MSSSRAPTSCSNPMPNFTLPTSSLSPPAPTLPSFQSPASYGAS
jgi:hypothetical protein